MQGTDPASKLQQAFHAILTDAQRHKFLSLLVGLQNQILSRIPESSFLISEPGILAVGVSKSDQ